MAKDGWDKFGTITQATAAILIPVVLYFASQWYTQQQKVLDDTQRNADRVTLLLNHLASENMRERLLAVQFVQYLAQSGQFPPELLLVVLNGVNDENEAVAQAASHALTEAVKAEPTLVGSVENAAKTNPEVKTNVTRAARLSPNLNKVIDVGRIQRAQ